MQQCLGCKTFLEENSKLPLEDLLIELKNYTYPIRDQKHRWILLKTIISFLNSKGGTIFIGVDDSTGEVRGIQIDRKQQDEYKLFLQKLTERIVPAVDLSNREDIIMHFLPVVRNGIFVGRYVAKIIVKQGELNKLYCLSQKIVLQQSNDKKYDEFDVVYSFKRVNMGSVVMMEGYAAVAEAASKAANPNKLSQTFHPACNPEPLDIGNYPDGDINGMLVHRQSGLSVPNVGDLEEEQGEQLLIQFNNIRSKETTTKLQQKLDILMDQLGISQYNLSYDEENCTLLLQLDSKQSWAQAIPHIDQNLQQINQQMKSCVLLVKKQHEDDYVIYHNEKAESESNICSGEMVEVKEEDQPEGNGQVPVDPPILTHKSESIEEQIRGASEQPDSAEYRVQVIEEKSPKKKRLSVTKHCVQLPSNIDIGKNPILTITHLNPSRKAELIQFVNELDTSNKKFKQYDKSIEFIYQNFDAFDRVYRSLESSPELIKFGFRGTLRFGINTGQISFQNYDKRKYREFKAYITQLLGPDIHKIEFLKKGDKYNMLLTLQSPQLAIEWLDRLVGQKEVKAFRVPNAQGSNKMKVDLVCVKPAGLCKLL